MIQLGAGFLAFSIHRVCRINAYGKIGTPQFPYILTVADMQRTWPFSIDRAAKSFVCRLT
jgi:hypothetical protein